MAKLSNVTAKKTKPTKKNKPIKVVKHWNETWVPIEFEGETYTCDYAISSAGRIKSIHKKTGDEREIHGTKVAKGLKVVNIRIKDDRPKGIYVHKFVAEHFVEKDDESKNFIIHKDGNKSNNNWENLQWATQKELYDFQVKIGIYDNTVKASRERAKMSESKVRLLKKWLKEGKTKKTILAKRMGISYMQLNRIERGENWGHVK